ncbi:MAG: ATP-dependent DNA helicase DinG [Gammaproteobacteria bacterium]|nr:ATP-dependent DNA helicase DinG [Gammaproteobacteria bacterium]
MNAEVIENPVPLAGEVKQHIRDALTSVGEKLPGFRARYPQRLMIAEIAKTFAGEYESNRRLICVEGPTGTGKTLAYLLSAIPVAMAQNKQLVIASATVALQEQLLLRDIPDVARLSGLDFVAVLAKGRGRYVCTRDLVRYSGADEAEHGQGTLFEGEEALWDRPPQQRELESLSAMLKAWRKMSWLGDRDSWHQPLEDSLWQKVSSDRHTCTGRRCDYYDDCPFYQAREGLRSADVIIANHDMVLVDLMMGGGVILPKPEEAFYVFDEAHHLANKALSHFSAQAQVRGSRYWLKGAPKSADTLFALLDSPSDDLIQEQIEEDVRQTRELLKSLDFLLDESGWFSEDDDCHRFSHGKLPAEWLDFSAELAMLAKALFKAFQKLQERLNKAQDDGAVSTAELDALLPSLGVLNQRLENFSQLWTLMAQEDQAGRAPLSRWVERMTQSRESDYLIAASPIDVAHIYEELLWSRCAGALLTSATLTAAGSFSRFRQQVGLHEGDGTQYVRLLSPFDYPNRARLVIPKMASEPTQANAHTEELIELLPKLLEKDKAALVLFSSRWQMQRVADGLPLAWRDALLIQGSGAKQQLLERHVKACGKGERSILFGLASFAEGLDLAGELCTHVVIAKLPFSVPNSPVEEAAAEWVESCGGNAFMQISVPDAGIRLMQACGRLLRSEDDEGTITILDRRLVSKRYGALLLAGLPPFERVFE